MSAINSILSSVLKDSLDDIKQTKEFLNGLSSQNKADLLKDINVLMDSAQDLYLTYIKGTEKGIFDRTLTDAINATEVAYGNLRICKSEDINKIFYGAINTYITARQQVQLKQLKEMASKFMNEMERLGL